MKFLKYTLLGLLVIVLPVGYFLSKSYHQPPHYRTTEMLPTPYRFFSGLTHGHSTFNTTGLQDLHAIASGYLDFHHLKNLHLSSSSPLVVLNGLNNDVLYLKEKNLRFFCLKYKDNQLVPLNRGFAKNLVCRTRQLMAGIQDPWSLPDQALQTESSLLSNLGISYHTPLPSNWLADWTFMDDFIHFFDHVETESTLYFHCGHGQGRTTTMLTLWDVYNNAQTVPVQDIISRQYLLGGEDLMNVEQWKDSTWPTDRLIARRNLILAFYKYMNDKDGYQNVKWSEWLEKQPWGPEETDINVFL